MMWVLAVVVVAILAAAAFVGSGRWGEMPALVDDRPTRLPGAGRPMGPDDLRDVRFSVVTRGYSMSQVDAMLERLARQMETSEQPPLGAGPTGSPVPHGIPDDNRDNLPDQL